MYSDDTHLTYANNDIHLIQSCLNEDLQNISKWLTANKLTLNMTKTESMLIGFRQKLSTLTEAPVLAINGVPIDLVSTAKSLGVRIDANLTWNSHIEMIGKQIAPGIAAIKRVKQFVSLPPLYLIYKT